ncbi:MAG: hypothetical protein IBJ11_04255, partial [Phycisphaerales bacterium]|nr:hypothetical protein [Phycisphaerales bacterium]
MSHPPNAPRAGIPPGAAPLLSLPTPMDLAAATLAASRWSDTLLPPLAAVPLMLLG